MLIIDMPMPRNCDECEVNYDCAFCGITGSAFYGNTQVPDFMPDERKLPDCPIKGELVRCGECKYRKIKHQWNAEPYNECELTRRCVEDDWFCADGERRNDGNTTENE